jgi:hypothetical protein
VVPEFHGPETLRLFFEERTAAPAGASKDEPRTAKPAIVATHSVCISDLPATFAARRFL